MVRINTLLRYNFLLLLVLTGCDAFAQNVVFSAAASATKMGVKDQVQVQYTIQDADDLQSVTPAQALFKDFDIVGGPYQSQNSQVYITNGKMVQSQSLVLTYVMQPKHTGTLTIPPAIAKDGAGHTYQSNALQIQVVPGSVVAQRQPARRDMFDDDPFDPFAAILQQRQRQLQALRQQQAQQQQQPQAQNDKPVDLGKDLFIKVAVDKSKVHVGEQITASYKLYARIPMNVSISKLPSLNGFWTQDFEMPKGNMKPVEEIVDGKKYQVFTLKKSALFPQQPGTLELDAAEAEGIARIIQQVRQRNPFAGFFDDPFFSQGAGSLMMSDPFFNDDFFNSMAYRDVKVHLKSTPVKITVTPLPETGKPEGYGNAVGNFTVTGKLDKTNISTDDIATLTLTIKGSGNLKLIEAPKINLPNGLTALDPQITDTITGRTTTISGSKTINYTITPNTAGTYTIPAVSFTYFDPASGKYITQETGPYTIDVKQGKNYKRESNTPLAIKEIHDISKKPIKDLIYNKKPLFYTVTYWSFYAVPLFAFIGLVVWRRREDELSKDIALLKNRRANKVALKRLATAQKLLQQNQSKPFYEEVSKAIWLYISDKLNIPLSSLSRETAWEILNNKKVPVEMQNRIEKVVSNCETALYAGLSGNAQMADTYRDAVDVISKLEESING